jgi:Holliday junction resolvasome RuvABC endonuclease subunit
MAFSNQDVRARITGLVDAFNRGIKLLVSDLHERNKNDAVVYRVKTKVFAAVEVQPVLVVDIVGGYLLAYAEQIYADADAAERFFIDNSFDGELAEAVDKEKRDYTQYVIPLVKRAWRGLSPEKKNEYRARVQGLLTDYLDYKDLADALSAAQNKI